MPAQQSIWLNDQQGLLPGPNHPGQQDEKDAIDFFVYAGRFTCRLRMISCCRKRAFSAMSFDLLLPKTVSVPSGNEDLSGLVQRAKQEESAYQKPSFSRWRGIKTLAIQEASPSHESIVVRACVCC